eukprot:TRINITY_DN13851_c0_g1_i1.p1 TRINITY_DN13851_c0_g1~~TRINITY_DN13851_c0_g1_i1.p1  ORF type:complete len:202 (+),score=38.05 TRINITY_DN13851_c0_g1_i1:156-761(+)
MARVLRRRDKDKTKSIQNKGCEDLFSKFAIGELTGKREVKRARPAREILSRLPLVDKEEKPPVRNTRIDLSATDLRPGAPNPRSRNLETVMSTSQFVMADIKHRFPFQTKVKKRSPVVTRFFPSYKVPPIQSFQSNKDRILFVLNDGQHVDKIDSDSDEDSIPALPTASLFKKDSFTEITSFVEEAQDETMHILTPRPPNR